MQRRNGDDLEIIQVKYAERMSWMSDAFLNFASYGWRDEQILMDYNFWVIRSADDVILLDTGYDVPGRNWLNEVSTVSPPKALAALGIDPLNVSTVIASHFHYDHVGFLQLFGNARVIAAQTEYDHWSALRGPGTRFEDHFVASPDLDEIYRAESEGRLVLVPEGPTEVVPGVTVYPVGGHTPGQLITLVRGQAGSVILTSDAAHLYEQIRYGWPFFAHSDLDQVKVAYRVIDDLAAQTDGVVVPGHDSRVREQFPPYPGPAGAFATVLTPQGS